jgi:hypothetical protein
LCGSAWIIEYTTYVEHVRREGRGLAAARKGNLVAQVYEHKIACTELGRTPDPWPPEWPLDRDPIARRPRSVARDVPTQRPDDVLTRQCVAIATGGRTWWVTLERASVRDEESGPPRGCRTQGDPSDGIVLVGLLAWLKRGWRISA